jgi:hypothetical protein
MVSMENSVQESIDITGSESISSKAVLRGYLMNLHLKRVWMIQLQHTGMIHVACITLHLHD